MALLNKYENTNNEEVSQEDFSDVNVAFEHVIASLESFTSTMEELDSEIERMEALEEQGVDTLKEPVSPALEHLFTKASFESFSEVVSMEEEISGMSGFLKRIRDGFAITFTKLFDDVSDLFKSYQNEAKKYKEKLNEIEKRVSSSGKKEFKGSYEGFKFGEFFVADGNLWKFSRSLTKDIQELAKASDNVFNGYVSNVEKELNDVNSIIKNADLSNNEAYKKTVSDKLLKKTHPITFFNKSLIGKSFIGMKVFSYTGKNKKTEVTSLSDNKGVKFSTPINLGTLFQDTTKANSPDVILTTSDVKNISNSVDALLTLSTKFLSELGKKKSDVRNTYNAFTTLQSKANKNVSINNSDAKLLVGYVKVLVNSLTQPSVALAKHNLYMAKNSVRLLNRITIG